MAMHFAATNLSSGKGRKAPGFMPNQRIPDGTFEPKELERLIRIGAVVAYDESEVTEKAVSTGESRTVYRAMWTFRTEDLAGLPIETLNMMIAQHVLQHGLAKVDPFDDVDEAISWMTKDLET